MFGAVRRKCDVHVSQYDCRNLLIVPAACKIEEMVDILQSMHAAIGNVHVLVFIHHDQE
jgi:hypothetical protein